MQVSAHMPIPSLVMITWTTKPYTEHSYLDLYLCSVSVIVTWGSR